MSEQIKYSAIQDSFDCGVQNLSFSSTKESKLIQASKDYPWNLLLSLTKLTKGEIANISDIKLYEILKNLINDPFNANCHTEDYLEIVKLYKALQRKLNIEG